MAIEFTPEEREIIVQCDTPEKVQKFLDGLAYNYEEDGATLRSFRRVVRDGVAHCMEGALVAASVLREHGYPPRLLCMEAKDIDHMIFPYRDGFGLLGAVAQSRDPNLRGRKPQYRTLRDLVMSYYPYYFNYFSGDLNDLTLRGFTLVDLVRFGDDIAVAEHDLWDIEDLLYRVRYFSLFSEIGSTKFMSSRDGSIKWV